MFVQSIAMDKENVVCSTCVCAHKHAHTGISFSLKKENPVILNNMDKSQGLYASEISQRKTTTALCQLYVESKEKNLNAV